jgi:6-phosphogluconate dehydrogenase
MMPGGNIESYTLIKNIVEAIAAKTDDGLLCFIYWE